MPRRALISSRPGPVNRGELLSQWLKTPGTTPKSRIGLREMFDDLEGSVSRRPTSLKPQAVSEGRAGGPMLVYGVTLGLGLRSDASIYTRLSPHYPLH